MSTITEKLAMLDKFAAAHEAAEARVATMALYNVVSVNERGEEHATLTHANSADHARRNFEARNSLPDWNVARVVKVAA